MKFLFLDFDGVMHPLNQGKTFTNTPVLWSILETLNDLNVVISSSWREHHSIEKMTRLLTQNGGEHLAARIVGTTPLGNNIQRGHECLQWLADNHHESAPWLAVDDDPLLFIGMKNHLFETDPKTGLTRNDVKQIINHFSGDN